MKNITHLLDCENRRIAPRLRKTVMVGVRDQEGTSFQTHAINVSQTGIRIVTDNPIAEGANFELDLTLENNDRVNFRGRTVWQRPIGSMGVHVVGLAFEPNQQLSTPQLVSWLKSHGVAA